MENQFSDLIARPFEFPSPIRGGMGNSFADDALTLFAKGIPLCKYSLMNSTCELISETTHLEGTRTKKNQRPILGRGNFGPHQQPHHP